MNGASQGTSLRVTVGPLDLVVAAIGSLTMLWASIALEAVGVPVTGLRILAGVASLFVPGVLLARLLRVGTDSAGRFCLFVGGLGLAWIATLTVFANAVLPAVGVEAPLGAVTMAALLTVTTPVLLVAVAVSDGWDSVTELGPAGPAPVLLLVFSLPTLAALGATALRWTGSSVGMALFVAVLASVVLLSATRVVPAGQYPVVVFFVGLATLLHVNLVTNHVVGNDVQLLYFAADRVTENRSWAFGTSPSAYALPVVTSVPAVIATLTGMELWTVFTTVYVLLYSLVPVGVFYVGRRVFDDAVGLFGSLFFLFYHFSFTYTPGKQLMAELFVVSLLVLYFYDGLTDRGGKGAALLLALGLVFSHYATTLVYGLAFAATALGLSVAGRLVGPIDYRSSSAYPVGLAGYSAVLLAGGTAWYAAASQPLVGRLLSVPPGLFEQFVALATGGTIAGGAGASYVAEQTTLLDDLNLYLYVAVTALVAVGLASRTVADLVRAWREERPSRTELTALGLPLFAFLGASYVVIASLYADRVYQMVLTVLAPFVPVGYRALAGKVGPYRVPWAGLAALLVVLLAFNSGLAFWLVGEAETTTFDPDAHESTFTAGERAGAAWLAAYSGAEPSGAPAAPDQLEVRDYPDRTAVYADAVSYQLLRSELPTGYFDVELVVLKSEYRPTVEYAELDEGYVFVRRKAVVEPGERRPVAPKYLSTREARAITRPRNVVYTSGEARIVAAGYGPGVNQTGGPTPSVPG